MHKDFAEWHRAAGIQPDANTLPMRWAAIQSFAVDRGAIADAARLFYGLPLRNPNFVETLRAELQKADAAVKMSGNERELAVVAGAILIDTIECGEAPLSHFAALATVCPAAKNLRKAPIVASIPELASSTLGKWSSDRTIAHPNGAPTNEKPLSAKGLEDLRNLCKAGELTALAEPLAKIYQALQKEQKRPQEMLRQLALHSEESNMLWWLLGEYSRDTKKPFSEHTPAAACLIAGKELADLTRELPGPSAAVAFLDRLTRAGRKKFPAFVNIESSVNETPRSWKEEMFSRAGVDAVSCLAPVTEAVRASLQVPEGESWSAIYFHATGVKAEAKVAPNDLADQVYLENLLICAWNLSPPHE